jgi:tetratricopeptide (TPR) repeat protein
MYAAVIVIDTIALFFSGTRGTVIGLIAGIIVTALLVAYTMRHVKRVQYAAVGSLVTLLVIVGGFWSLRTVPAIRDIGFLQRLATISAQDDTVMARFINWHIAWQGVKEKPILGWGQENFAIVFDKYYDPSMYAQEQWFDRVHNIVLDWLVAGGFLGLISYVSIFLAALWLMWRGKVFTVTERSIITGLLVAYTCHNFFVFDNVTSYILFGMVLSYIAWRYADAHEGTPLLSRLKLPRGSGWYVGVVTIAIAGLSVWSINASAYAANVTLLSSLISNQGGPTQNLAVMQSAIAYGSYGTQEAREQLVQMASQVASAPSVPNDVKQQFFNVAAQQMTLQSQASPLDARFPFFLGMLFDTFGDHADAKTALTHALALSPQKQSIMFSLGNNALSQGDTTDAVALFKKAYEEYPADYQARMLYAAILIRTGDPTTADAVIAPIKGTNVSVDSSIIGSYATMHEYQPIVTLEEAYLASHTFNPSTAADTQAYAYLATAYYGLGQRDKALETLATFTQLDPGAASQIAQMVDQVKNGTLQLP